MDRYNRVLSIVAVVAAALAFARLTDAFGKRELVRVAHELDSELAVVDGQYRQLIAEADRLDQDERLLCQRIAFMSKREHYLVISRRRRRLQLLLGDKEMLEVKYKLRGPADGVSGFGSLPKATLEVLGVETRTSWHRPDWLYRLEGIDPPADSFRRLVRDAFGPGQIFLGGAIAIHGRVRDQVPAEAIDHTYLQLDDASLKAVVGALKPGALVFIQ